MTKNITQNITETKLKSNYVGIDISKLTLDIATFPDNEINQFSNDNKGHRALHKWLGLINFEAVIFESTGSYHQELRYFLGLKNIPFSLINPRHAKHFGQALGKLAKTDKADALMLAKFGQLMQPKNTINKSQAIDELEQLITARRALLKEKAAINNRQHIFKLPLLKRQIKQKLKQIDVHIKAIDLQCEVLIKDDVQLKARRAILTSIPGLGVLSATIMLCLMPELGQMDKRQTAALAGLAPITRQSGNWQGKSFIRGGRAHLRHALYMPALVAMRYNPDMKKTYQRLIANGKPAKVAIIAIMRKLIITANALLRDGRNWQNNTA